MAAGRGVTRMWIAAPTAVRVTAFAMAPRYPKAADVTLPAGDWKGAALWMVTDPEQGTHTYSLPIKDRRVKIGLPGYGIGTLSVGAPAGAEAALAIAEPGSPAIQKGAKLF